MKGFICQMLLLAGMATVGCQSLPDRAGTSGSTATGNGQVPGCTSGCCDGTRDKFGPSVYGLSQGPAMSQNASQQTVRGAMDPLVIQRASHTTVKPTQTAASCSQTGGAGQGCAGGAGAGGGIGGVAGGGGAGGGGAGGGGAINVAAQAVGNAAVRVGEGVYDVATNPPPGPNVREKTGWSNMELYDPCYFERYSNLAHRAVNRALAPQVINGHVLTQTVWNHYFEPGTDRLTPGGISELQMMSRRRPEPDRVVYLATAIDLPYDPKCPERYCGARQELDGLRVAAIQKFLVGHNCGRNQEWQVLVHDPADVTMPGSGTQRIMTSFPTQFRAALAGGGGAAPGGTAGPTGQGISTGTR